MPMGQLSLTSIFVGEGTETPQAVEHARLHLTANRVAFIREAWMLGWLCARQVTSGVRFLHSILLPPTGS